MSDIQADIPRHVIVTDVVGRDGFQDEPRIIPTDEKVRVIEGLVRAGVTSIEVTSFVHPKVVPQMADAAEVLARVPRDRGVTYSALLPNLKGAQRALAAGIDEIHLVVSASEGHNRANLNRSTQESLAQLREVAEYVRAEDPKVALVGTIATSFGCPFDGKVPVDRLLWVIEQFRAMGMDSIALADTTGMANPLQVGQTVAAVKQRFPEVDFQLHLHNTRGLGLANAFAGLQVGVTRFDASLGGLGGCPFAPGATGNISTEDLVHMLHEMGTETGIDLDALIAEAKKLPDIVGHDVESFVIKGGKACDLHPFEEIKIARAAGA